MMNFTRVRLAAPAILLLASRAAMADPISPDLFGLVEGHPLTLLVPVAAFMMEYAAVRWLLGDRLPPRTVLWTFLRINLVTFPVAELLSLFISWPAEIVPLLVEPILFERVARKAGVTIPALGLRIIGANLFSFVVGIVMYVEVMMFVGPTDNVPPPRPDPVHESQAAPDRTPEPPPAR